MANQPRTSQHRGGSGTSAEQQSFSRGQQPATPWQTSDGGGSAANNYHHHPHHQRDHSHHHDYTNISTTTTASRNTNSHQHYRDHHPDQNTSFIPISGSSNSSPNGYNNNNREIRHDNNNNNRGEFRHASGHPAAVGNRNDPSVQSVRVEAPIFQDSGGGGAGRGRRAKRKSFEQLREEAIRQRTSFEDKEFLPELESIYFSRQPTHPFTWMRPGQICTPQKPVFEQGFDRFDVEQGQLGDCWFVAAMACLCGPDHRQLLDRVIPVNQNFHDRNYAGIFRFHFWHFGEWEEVIIDDLLPTKGGSLWFVHSTQKNEFWPALMEKAYSKLYGSYEALKGGWMPDSLTDLTGGVAESFTLRGEKANYPRNIISILLKAVERMALIGCGITGTGPGESKLPSGLIAGHAYSVTALKNVPLQSGDVMLIRIRNPHGTNEWNGAWSDRSSQWRQVPSEARDRLQLIQRDDGEFWMDFRDFMGNFDSLVICNLSADDPSTSTRKWHSIEHHGRWVKHFNAGGRPSCRDSFWSNPQYVLTLQDTDDDDDKVCSFIVQLMQKDRRKIKRIGENFKFIGFVIYKLSSGDKAPLKKDFFQHNSSVEHVTFTNTRQIVKRFALPRGTYVLVPSTWDKDEEADFYMRFFLEKGNVSEYADEPPEKVEVPPPIPSAKHREQEEQFQKFFYEMSGEDMEIDCFELHRAVNEALKKEPLHKEIGLDACRSFISLTDVDNSGRLDFTEFQYLWSMLRSWKKIFLQYDADNSGKMDSRELRTALAFTGYKVSNQMLAAAIFRFADSRGGVSLDHFLILMARLMKLFNVYQQHKKDDRATFTLQQWVCEALRS